MTIKSLLLILFLCVCLIWVGAASLHPGAEFLLFGFRWTAVILIAALAFVVGSHLFGWLRLRKAKAATRPAVPAKAAPIVHEDDVALAGLIAEANTALAKSASYAGAKGRPPLSGLPIYLLVGPLGAGKTSTFLNSGIEPQLLAGDTNGKAPFASTRLCNLWLAKNAVFIEFSGRTFGGDLGRWGRLLTVLRGKASVPWWRSLWREPDQGLTLRGVIGFCDVKELTGASADPQRLESNCREWQERLRAIAEVFDVDFPVYQVFTRCDKLPFFADFFGRLPESEANQVLGCTIPIRRSDPLRPAEGLAEVEAKRLTGSFRPLYQSLAERRLTHLAHEPNPARRPGIYEFPRELKRIRSPLVQFLTDVFRPHPLCPVPLLRGYYLTAVREVEVAAADLAVSREDWTSPNLGMEATRLFRGDATQIFSPEDANKAANPIARKGTGLRWIFASDLFHQVVLADQPVQRPVAVDARFERYRLGALAGICGLCALLCLAFTISWARNRQLLHDVAVVGSAEMRKRGGVVSLSELRALEGLRSQVERLQKGEGLSYRWGLYQGNAILDYARNAYFRRFQQLLLNDLNGVILGQLQSLPATPGPNDSKDPAYNRLKTHLMISSGACKPEQVLVSKVLKEARALLNPDGSLEWQSLADTQIAFYINALGDGNPVRLTENAEVGGHARQYLLKVNGFERIYGGILANAEKAVAKPARLDDLAPNYKLVMEGPDEVNAAFTHDGWQFVKDASKNVSAGDLGEPCVTGNISGNVSELIQQRFIRDYIAHWHAFVVGFSVLKYKSPQDAEQKLDLLASNRSPLLALLKMTADQTDFSIPTKPGFMEKAGSFVGDLTKRAEKAANKVTEAAKDTRQLSSTDVTRFFQPVWYVVPANSERWINDKNKPYLDALGGLRTAVKANSGSLGDPPDPQIYQTPDKAEDSVRQLAAGFDPNGVGDLDQQVTRLLKEPITNARPFIIQPDPSLKAEAALQKFCARFRSSIGKFYPFNPSGTDLPLQDFADYFAPGQGAILKFQSSSLAELTILDGGVWKQNPASQKLKASEPLLEFLNKAQQITKTFFSDGGAHPRLSYTLRPHLASGQVISLRIDGDSHEFSEGAGSLQHVFTWPAAQGKKQEAVGLSGAPGFMSGFSGHDEGAWAVFRMFGDAEPRNQGAPTIEWKQTKGRSGNFVPIQTPVMLEFVGFPSGVDIFNPKFLGEFQCPLKVAQ